MEVDDVAMNASKSQKRRLRKKVRNETTSKNGPDEMDVDETAPEMKEALPEEVPLEEVNRVNQSINQCTVH